MYDALEELADFHEICNVVKSMSCMHLDSFQERSLTMESFKSGSVWHFKEIMGGTSSFRGIELHRGSKCDLSINISLFFQSLANNLRSSRLFSNSKESASHADTQSVTCGYSYTTDSKFEVLVSEILAWICFDLPKRPVFVICDRFTLSTSTCIQEFENS